jgi:hypothetical protein
LNAFFIGVSLKSFVILFVSLRMYVASFRDIVITKIPIAVAQKA